MDLSGTLNEIDTTFLLDSGTESCTNSPNAADDNGQCEDFSICDIGSPKCKTHLGILDKAVSVDEDVLATPLEPVALHYIANNLDAIEVDDIADEHLKLAAGIVLPSILRRESYYNGGCKPSSLDSSSTSSTVLRRVSFPTDEAELASYREPEYDFRWTINSYLPPEKILQIYQASCKQHKTIELDIIKQLITDIKNNTNHSAILNLSMVSITNEVNETLEDLLKVANFRTLILYECKFTSETISEFLNMLEYYESVCEIEVAMNFDDIEIWKCFCSACSNIMVLESISCKGMVINENYTRMLLNAVKNNDRITTLKFDGCTLMKLPSFYLVENLMTNRTLCELYLPSTGLYTKEADCLGHFLQRNLHLKVLDISNNFIGDRGIEVLAKGLTKQNTLGYGLSVLVMFNNQITEKSGPIINNIITECKNLHTLNIGFNNLTDQVLFDIGPSLEVTTSLEGFGLQCTLLTCKGIDYLANSIEHNTSLQKINLKGNKAIQVGGLERLCQALTTSKISKIEVDETNRSCNDPQAYLQLVKKMNAICTVNKSFKESSNNDIVNLSQLISRKVSLSCEPNYIVPEFQAHSPALSPVMVSRGTSPAPKSRFKITNVQDYHSPRPISRFKVTRVTPSPDEETTVHGKFAYVRSSVSSNDSVDSLQLDTDSD